MKFAVLYLPRFWVAFENMNMREAAMFVSEYNGQLSSSVALMVPMYSLAGWVQAFQQFAAIPIVGARNKSVWFQVSHGQERFGLLGDRNFARFPLLLNGVAGLDASGLFPRPPSPPS
jgi:hypothetical protein